MPDLSWLKDLGIPGSVIAALAVAFFLMERYSQKQSGVYTLTLEERRLLSADELSFRQTLIEQLRELRAENVALREEVASLRAKLKQIQHDTP